MVTRRVHFCHFFVGSARNWSGSRSALLHPGPLRTGRAPFDASRLKHPKGPGKDSVLHFKTFTVKMRLPTLCLRVRQLPWLYWMNPGQATVHPVLGLSSGIPSPRGLPHGPVTGHPMEVCPLVRGMMLPGGPDAIPIPPITGRRSLPPSSFTRSPIGSPCGSLSQREDYGLTTFRVSTKNGLGLASSPVAPHLRPEICEPRHLATCLLAQACQHLWLVRNNDV